MTSNLPAVAARGDTLARHEVLGAFFQGLSDPTRVRILELLAERPLTVTELVDRLDLAQGRVSATSRACAGAGTWRPEPRAATTAIGWSTSGFARSCASASRSSGTTPRA